MTVMKRVDLAEVDFVGVGEEAEDSVEIEEGVMGNVAETTGDTYLTLLFLRGGQAATPAQC